MKLFIDSADVEVIRSAFETGLIDGVTTNPTLIRKSGRDPEDVYQELIDMGVTDVSMEVVGDDEIMLAEGRRLANKFGKNATIKVPCSPEGLWVCKQLTPSIKVNVTLIFSPSQAILSAKAGATYVSPFVGRVDDNSFGGLCLVKDIANIYTRQNVYTEILAASIRNVRDVGRAFEYGANICTIPPTVFNKITMNAYSDSLWEKNPEWMIPYNWDGEPFKEIRCLSTNPCIVKFVMNEYALDLQNPEDLENLKKQGWYKINADKQREIKRMLYNMKKISLKELDQRDIDLFNSLQKQSKKDEN